MPAMQWAGSRENFLDRPDVTSVHGIVLGRYGGRADAGASKNEDAAFVKASPDGRWEVAAVADGHGGCDSSALAVQLLDEDPVLPALLGLPVSRALPAVHAHLLGLLQAADTSGLSGETALLVAARRDRFLYWACIGDCTLYVLHHQLAAFGQYALNQRSFYEWFGQVNSLRLEVPCYATGVHALRPGLSRIVLVTDGLLEFGERPYVDARRLYEDLAEGGELAAQTGRLLQAVHDARGTDSATIVAWDARAGETVMYPSS
jgi:serine/threonine protein phosphatase PrpC